MSTIETERLILRPYEARDRDDYLALVTDETAMKFVDEGHADPATAEDWWNRLLNRLYPGGQRWCARTRDTGVYAGHAMINYTRPNNGCELGYILPRSMWGRGYATEISRAIAGYSKEVLGLPEIFATVDEGHDASIGVLEKTGMKFHGFDFDEDGRYLVYVLKHEGEN